MELLVIGTGYVGLVTGTCFAEVGFHVTCLDIDSSKIEKLQRNEIPIYETGLQEMVARNSKAGRLRFTTSYEEGLKNPGVAFICVDTPSNSEGACDLSSVRKVAVNLAGHMKKPLVVVNKSTAPIGTCENIRDLIAEELKKLGKDIPFSIASNPEFLKEGCAVADFLKPDRVVIGVDDEKTGEVLSTLYSPFNLNRDRLLIVDLRSSEMIKYAANAMLATRISFMNELAGLCEHLGCDINLVRKGLGSDTRIGHSFLYPGVGFGGSCFPKDIRALRSLAKRVNYPTMVLDAVDLLNRSQKRVLSLKILHYFGERAKPTLAIWGLAFKPETDDMREAPSLTLIETLFHRGYTLRLFDPIAMESAKKALDAMEVTGPRIIWCSSEHDAATGSDGIALVTEWKQFRQVDFEELKKEMEGRVVFDGRNQYRLEDLAKHGFDYISIGRKSYLDPSNSPSRTKDPLWLKTKIDE